MSDTIDSDLEFTDEQMLAVLKRVGDNARQAAFSAGLPIMIVKDAQLVLVHPSGTEEVVAPLRPEQQQEPHES
jgi:hypothetical protein